MNTITESDLFSELYAKLDATEKEWIGKMVDQLKANIGVGKPLVFDWLREKKFGNKRLFFLVNERLNKVMLFSFNAKNEQQDIIDHIIKNKERYLRMLNQIT